MPDMVSTKNVGTEYMACCEPTQPRYSWGTRLCLNDELVEALKASGYQVGEVVQVTALAVVCSKGDRMDMDEPEGIKTSLDLQVTELAIDKAPPSDGKISALYPNSKMEG